VLTDLDKNELLQVLTEIKNNYISQYQYLFSIDNIELNFDTEALEQLVDNCLALKTGARGLHTEIERCLMPHMYNIRKYQNNGITLINISQDIVIDPRPLL